MTTKIYIPKADKGFDLAFTIRDASGNAFNLSGYTIKLKVWKKGESGTLLLEGTCTIDNAVAGTCHYSVVVDDFDSTGEFIAELEFTKTDTIESTQSFTVEVTESG